MEAEKGTQEIWAFISQYLDSTGTLHIFISMFFIWFYRYLSSDDCTTAYYYACETTPLTQPADYPCPSGFFPFKNECFNPNQLTLDYDSAMVITHLNFKGAEPFCQLALSSSAFFTCHTLTRAQCYKNNFESKITLQNVAVFSQRIKFS
jgi:hypothetical protein